MPRDLGIRKGDIWAFRENRVTPLVPAKIVNQPANYEASITIRLVNSPERGLMSVRRVKLPVRWDRVEGYIVTQADILRQMQAPKLEVPADKQSDALDDAATDLFSVGEETIRRIVREELDRGRGEIPRLSLNYQDAAIATGYSANALRTLVDRGDLIPSYANSKPVFRVEELQRWLLSLSSEPPRSY